MLCSFYLDDYDNNDNNNNNNIAFTCKLILLFNLARQQTLSILDSHLQTRVNRWSHGASAQSPNHQESKSEQVREHAYEFNFTLQYTCTI